MSTQKLLAEAEKLLERGKADEAIVKLQACLTSDPNNQLVVNKLSAAFLEVGDTKKAVATLSQFARKMSEGGKPLVAVAIYKQALDLDPQNISLIQDFAIECVEAGKLSEAQVQCQKLLSYYLPRKKYFDALNIFPLLARILPKDESIKELWVQTMANGLAEMKLLHLLVALLGPPGIVSDEFDTGGDPTQLSEKLFRAIVNLLPWFPRDPKLPYAIAWGFYKRGNLQAAYVHIQEAIRRDPDFVLSPLLFARILSDQKKLNECLFVFKYAKEKIMLDKQVEAIVLNRQVEAFEQNNGWIAFSEGTSDSEELTAEEFIKSFISKDSSTDTAGESNSAASQNASIEAGVSTGAKETKNSDVIEENNVGGEIDIGLAPAAADIPMEIELGHGGISTEKHEEKIEKESVEFTAMIEAPPQEVSANAAEVEVASDGPIAPPPVQVVFTPAPNITAPPVLKPEAPAVKDQEPEVIEAAVPVQEDKTEIISRESLESVIESEGSLLENLKNEAQDLPMSESDATQIISIDSLKNDYTSPIQAVEAALGQENDRNVADSQEISQDIEVKQPESVLEALNEEPDLGDDLLEHPTEMIGVVRNLEDTSHLENEIKRLQEERESALREPKFFIEQAERYLSKKNYYMARKSLRHALALGGKEDEIKSRLNEIRRLELPKDLYASSSDDSLTEEPIEVVIARLEQEFKLEPAESAISDASPEVDLEALFSKQDTQTIVDLGVGYLEMGLAHEAEKIFFRLSKIPDDKTIQAALFLLAQAKMEQNDFGGAIGDLKRLAKRANLSDQEKLSVFYALGEAFEKMQSGAESKKYYKKAAKIDSNYRNLKEKIGEKRL